MDNSIDFLKDVEIFSMLESDELEQIVDYFDLVEIDEGKKLFKQGDKGNELYIVKSGTIATSIALPDDGEKEIATFNEGSFFGEMSIFEDAPRSATCFSKEKSVLLGLEKNEFFEIIDRYPGTAIKMMYRMLNVTTGRLRDTGEFLSDMVHWGETASKRAITDEFTGAYNRRFLDDAIVKQVEVAKMNKTDLSLVMVDLDYFRIINDNYGHDVGDQLILEIVKIFNKHLRETDMLARYGGDEFTVLMPETSIEEARNVVENVRKEINELDTLESLDGPVNKVSTSQGVSSLPEFADSLESLKKMADDSLYKAKEGGRNRVFCSGDKE